MPNRTMCDVLEEMRMCHKTQNYASMLGLVEEAQSMANRMEATITEKKDYQDWHKLVQKEKDELRVWIKHTNKLRKKQGKEPKEMPHYP